MCASDRLATRLADGNWRLDGNVGQREISLAKQTSHCVKTTKPGSSLSLDNGFYICLKTWGAIRKKVLLVWFMCWVSLKEE